MLMFPPVAASNDFAERGRILIEQMANDKKALKKDVEEHIAYAFHSFPCVRKTKICLHRSGESASLAAQRQELEDERAKFTDAAIRLARERSEFEVRCVPCPISPQYVLYRPRLICIHLATALHISHDANQMN